MRCKAEYLEGTRIKYICPKGHEWTEDLGKGSKSKRLSDTAVRMMASWWKTGVNIDCPQCKKEKT